MKEKIKVELELDRETYAYLEILATGVIGGGSVVSVLEHLAHSAADGMRRPGAWECGWLRQAFGDEWTAELEPVPDLAYLNLRPRAK